MNRRPLPKSGEKRGSGHLETSIGSDSSTEDLDTEDTRPKKKASMPVKMASSNTGQWTNEDLDVVRQLCYKTDLDHFQTYWRNKIMPGDLSTINTKDHSAYIEIAKVHPGTVVKKVFLALLPIDRCCGWRVVTPPNLTERWEPPSRSRWKGPGHQTLRK